MEEIKCTSKVVREKRIANFFRVLMKEYRIVPQNQTENKNKNKKKGS